MAVVGKVSRTAVALGFAVVLVASVNLFKLGGPVPASAQEVRKVTVSDPPACPTCKIVLEQVGSLRTTPEVVVYSTGQLVGTHSHYVLTHRYDRSRLLVFDKAGRYLRSLGNKGEGPGEYLEIWALALGSYDSVHLFDTGLRRHAVYDSALHLASTHTYYDLALFDNGLLVLGDGSLIFNGIVHTRAGIGYPLHRAVPGNGIIASFGTDNPRYDGHATIRLYRRLAKSRDGGFWAVHLVDYIVEYWTAGGELKQVLHRDAPWFNSTAFDPEKQRVETQGKMPPPFSTVVAIREAKDGSLRLLSRVPDPKVLPESITGMESFALFDAMLEVMDPRSGTLIATERFEHYPLGFIDDDHIFTYPDSDLSGRIDIWRLRIEGR